jgi:hypothetical protein
LEKLTGSLAAEAKELRWTLSLSSLGNCEE